MSRILNVEATLSRIDNDLERLDQLYEIALDELPRWESRMKEKMDTGESEQIRKIAHAYKGSSATLGAEVLQELLINLEAYAKNEKIDNTELTTYYSQFCDNVGLLISNIKQYLENRNIQTTG